MRMRRALTTLGAAWIGALIVVGCGDPGPATATDRLWVSELPTNPRAEITAFVVTRVRGDRHVGAFWQGTVFRGGHDLFEWTSTGKGRATMHFYQDERDRRVRIETCKPSAGFDHCIVLHGDPKGKGRYQSRKRWRLRGRKRADVPTLTATLAELAAEDEELAALVEPVLAGDADE